MHPFCSPSFVLCYLASVFLSFDLSSFILGKKKKKLFGHYYTLSMELYSDRWKQLYMARMDDVTDPEMIIHYRIGKTEEIVYSSVFRKSDFSFVQPDLWLVNRVWSQLVVPIVFVWGSARWG